MNRRKAVLLPVLEILKMPLRLRQYAAGTTNIDSSVAAIIPPINGAAIRRISSAPMDRTLGGIVLAVDGTAVSAGLAARVAAHRHARQARNPPCKPLPDPDAQALEARLFEALDFVQYAVIKCVAQRAAGCLQLRELDDESGRRVGCAANCHLDLKRMPVHAPVRVVSWKGIKTMGGVKAEGVGEFDDWRAHGIPSSL